MNSYSGDTTTEFNGVEMRIADVPDALIRAYLGYGHFPGHGREVVEVAGQFFPHTPDTCLTDLYGTKWVHGDTVLVCLGCGLDAT